MSIPKGYTRIQVAVRSLNVTMPVFCVDENRMILLHGFIKKSQKTPQKEIDLALKRKKGEDR